MAYSIKKYLTISSSSILTLFKSSLHTGAEDDGAESEGLVPEEIGSVLSSGVLCLL